MIRTDIERAISCGESDGVEFKRGLGDLKKIGAAICSFANTTGGLVILGIDKCGTIVGVDENTETVLERLTGYLQTGLSSPVPAKLAHYECPAGCVVWIEVPKVRSFEPMRCGGKVYVRRGRSSVEPSPTELQELYNAFGYNLTEECYVMAASPDDLDATAFHSFLRAFGFEIFDDPQPVLIDDLRTRGAVTSVGGDLHPTLFGILAFGKQPQTFPQTGNFWIDCAAYDGHDRGDDVILVGEAKGRLDEQVDRALGWIRSLGRGERHRGADREDLPLIPDAVLREALVNAVVHRDYAITGSKILFEVFCDRVVVTSPGSLPNHMSPDSVMAGGHPRSRNELMANFMLVKRKMEQRGRGWPVMRKIMHDFNGTRPQLEVDDRTRFVRVTLWTGGTGAAAS